MARLLVRTALANLRSRPLQTALVALILAAASATLALAVSLRAGAADPYEKIARAEELDDEVLEHVLVLRFDGPLVRHRRPLQLHPSLPPGLAHADADGAASTAQDEAELLRCRTRPPGPPVLPDRRPSRWPRRSPAPSGPAGRTTRRWPPRSDASGSDAGAAARSGRLRRARRGPAASAG